MDKQTQSEFVQPVALGEGKGLAHELAQALAQGIVESLMWQVSPAPLPPERCVRRGNFFVSQPEVAARGPVPVVRRDAFTQGAGTLGGTISPTKWATSEKGSFGSGQAFIIAGPRDCGKSLLQKLITVLFGRRMASPYAYTTGITPFNSELFGAERLVIEDSAASTDIRARRNFGALLKTIPVNDDQPCYGKGREAINLTPFWRISISINDEPENLMVLPPIDKSVADKLILLKAVSTPMPRPTGRFDTKAR